MVKSDYILIIILSNNLNFEVIIYHDILAYNLKFQIIFQLYLHLKS